MLGADTTTDVAVLKVDATNLPVVALGKERDVQVGDAVLVDIGVRIHTVMRAGVAPSSGS